MLRLNIVSKSLKLFSVKSRLSLACLSVLQILINLFDILGVFLIGILSSSLISRFSNQPDSKVVIKVYKLVNIYGIDPSKSSIVIGLLTLLCFLLKTGLGLTFSYLTYKFLAKKQTEISNRAISAMLNAPYLLIKHANSNELSFAINEGIGAITVGLLGQFISLFGEIFLIAAFFTLLIAMNPFLTIITGLYFVIVLITLNFIIGPNVRKYSRQMTEVIIDSRNTIGDSLNLFREIRIYGSKEYFIKKYSEIRNVGSNAIAKSQWIQQVPKYILELSMIISILFLTAWYTVNSSTENAEATLAVFLAAASRIIPSLLRMQSLIFGYKGSLPVAERAFELLDKILDYGIKPHNQIRSTLKFEHEHVEGITIEVKNATFAYEDSTSTTLDKVSFKASQGESIAITGHSGSGKSTLCDLMLGLIKPNSGSIEIDGMPVERWIQNNPRKIGYLPQVSNLIAGDLVDNICVGIDAVDVDYNRLDAVIRMAKLDELVNSLPEGIKANLGEQGLRFSGGQKQRIGLARVLYSNPIILILDESTSSLDAVTEDAVISALESIRDSTLVIYIAHRMNLVNRMSRVMCLNNGRIESDGTFDQAIKNSHFFSEQARLMGFNS